MVRLLKVKELEDRKRFLLATSEMYRQTLTLEIANVKFSAALLKRKLKFRRYIVVLLGLTVPLAGFFFARKRSKPKAQGFLPKLMSGMKLFSQFAPWLKKFRPARSRVGERENITQFP